VISLVDSTTGTAHPMMLYQLKRNLLPVYRLTGRVTISSYKPTWPITPTFPSDGDGQPYFCPVGRGSIDDNMFIDER
jgi:hypothetical protein